MKRLLPASALALLVLAASAGHAAETAAPSAAEPTELRIQRIVVEDDGARIDELRVRGQATRIVVSPKRGRAAPYEILTGDGSRDLGFGANTSRGAAGQRVWNVLAF